MEVHLFRYLYSSLNLILNHSMTTAELALTWTNQFRRKVLPTKEEVLSKRFLTPFDFDKLAKENIFVL